MLDIDELASRVMDEHATLVHDGRSSHERVADAIRAALVDDAIAQVAALPAEGVAFVVLKRPDADDPIDHSAALESISNRVKEANPNGYVLVLPESWSFRTITHEHALQFIRALITFVSDEELAAAGLWKAPIQVKLTPEQVAEFETLWSKVAKSPMRLLPPETLRSLTEYRLGSPPYERDFMTDGQLAAIGLQRITETINEVHNRG